MDKKQSAVLCQPRIVQSAWKTPGNAAHLADFLYKIGRQGVMLLPNNVKDMPGAADLDQLYPQGS
jgi:hypothetical protein